MIRPFTCVCVLLAAGSGLYMYQAKHRTLMLDRQIADVLKQADAARARTAVLKAEYAALSAPARLDELSGRYLALKPSQPAQYVQLAALDPHLPPIETFPKPGEAPPPAPQPANATDGDAEGAPDGAPDGGRDGANGGDRAAALVASAAPLAGAPAAADVLLTGKLPPAAVVQGVPAAHAMAAAAHPARRAAQPGTQFAGVVHAQSMPMAAPRPVQSAVLATAALHPAGAPARPRITNAGYAAYAPPRGRAVPAWTPNGSVLGGSVLGGGGATALPPPVPVAN
jgi:hypothetical protein